MYHLVYTSIARKPFSDVELLNLVERARKTNSGLGITGLLLYQQGSFMQMLEGEEADVCDLYAAICKDARHHHVFTLVAKTVPSRQFFDWSMGYKQVEDGRFHPVIDSRPQPITGCHEDAPVALDLLGSFKINS